MHFKETVIAQLAYLKRRKSMIERRLEKMPDGHLMAKQVSAVKARAAGWLSPQLSYLCADGN